MDLSAAWRLSRLIKQLKPDIVHAHDPHGVAMAGLALSMSTQLAKPPLVASRRVDFHLRRQRAVALEVPPGRLLHLRVGGDPADARRRRRARRRGRSPCTKASTSSASSRRRRANLHEELFLPHQAPIVGNVAALVPHKGQRHLIEAAALVVRQVPDARFVIAGEGELRPALERQIKEHRLEKHVLLAGFRPDVLSLHKAFDVFVMSSITEGLGTSLLDAMAAGKTDRRDGHRRHPRSRGRRRDRVPRAAARPRGDGRRASCSC